MKLLFLLPHVPALHATAGGARSTAHLIAGLGTRHDVAVLCLRRAHDSPVDEVLTRACVAFDVVDADPAARQAAEPVYRMRLRMSPLVRTPAWVVRTEVPAFRQRLRSLLLHWRPDVVHLAYEVMGQYAEDLAVCSAARVLTVYEPGITPARDHVHASRGRARLRAALEAAAWVRYERRALRQADVVVALTERDRQSLAPLARDTPIVRIPIGVAIPARPLNPFGTSPPTVLFVGNFVHRPNVDAALWLSRTIFPLVKRVRPDAQLMIVGPGATGEIRQNAGAGVTVTGALDSVEHVLDGASVIAAPLRCGGGMRVKVMEALAAGKAVVASPLAAAGLDVEHGQQLLLAGAADEFAAAILRLLESPAERAALATRARAWAAASLGWERPVAAYDRLHERLLAAGADARAATRDSLFHAVDAVESGRGILIGDPR